MKSKKNLRKNLFKSYKSNIEQKFYCKNNKWKKDLLVT